MLDYIIIDLDDTITRDHSSEDYKDKELNPLVAKAISNAKKAGFKSKIFSSRNMRTYEGDVNKIEKFTRPIAEEWLLKNNIEYDELILGKPWAGKNGVYVDDKNIHIEEFIFRFCGPFYNKKCTLVTSLFNEEGNVMKMHSENKKAERLLDISEYIYVNNGSVDKTQLFLDKIKENDEKVRVISLKTNLGYGKGFKEGIKNANCDLIITNHADMQFNLYQFVLTNYEEIMNHPTIESILPKRLNRGFIDSINSMILRTILSILTLKRVYDFNGQPKFFLKELIKKEHSLPDDYCLDLALYNLLRKNALILPILQKQRTSESSSWSQSLSKRITIFLRYILYSIAGK